MKVSCKGEQSTHRALYHHIENKLLSMGLVLKASKCRSLSIKSGKTINIQFHLKNQTEEGIPIYSVLDKPIKVLGSKVSDDNSPHAMSASPY